jgi:hypothetical protein
MTEKFTPYRHGPEALIPVHVPNEVRPDGSVLVYLPNGTGLMLHRDQLLQVEPAHPNARSE